MSGGDRWVFRYYLAGRVAASSRATLDEEQAAIRIVGLLKDGWEPKVYNRDGNGDADEWILLKDGNLVSFLSESWNIRLIKGGS